MKKQTIAHHTFRHYVVIDDATGAVNTEETSAYADIVRTGIVKTDEDCAEEKDIEKCIARINLDSKLICYSDNKYTNKITNSTRLIVGDTIWCDLMFKDPSIKKYLHLTSVKVRGDGGDAEVLGTGWYTKGRKALGSTRFAILVWWPELVTIVIANARVSPFADCGDDNCVKCDGDGTCDICRLGLMT